MPDTPTIRQLMEAANISKSYAAVILSGPQPPSRPLAIHIYRKTGWRHQVISDLTDEQITILEEVEPWIPTRERAA